MYNLRSSSKETVEFPVQIEVADDSKFLTHLLNHTDSSVNNSMDMSDSHESSDSEIDCEALVKHSDNEGQSGSGNAVKHHSKGHTSKNELSDLSSDLQVQSVINSQILQQLQHIGNRLDKIENGTCKKTSDKSKIKSTKSKTKKVPSTKSSQQFETSNECKLPTLQSVKEDALIQLKVEQRLQELTELAKTGTNSKLKSQRGGNVEVMVKNRVKWPHEYILSGLNRERVSYDQLSVTQWVAGFGRTMREEADPVRQHMLDYMISLMDDANNFSWISAKASHAVLLCRMEQGEVRSYADFSAIDRIRRANAQKHVTPVQTVSPKNFSSHNKFGKTTKSMPCVYFNQGTCIQQKSHETRGVLYKHICASCFAAVGKTFPHAEIDCKNKQKGN